MKTAKKRFQVNKYIELLLRDDKTVIYVENKEFMQCKYLLLNIPVEKISSLDEIESVDEAAEKLDKSLEPLEGRVEVIPPETEFWGHCSNLQVWAENNYDTRLLHRNLAFPLLKKLSDVGDPLARKMFKDEIIRRIKEGNAIVLSYLIGERYFKYFSEEEFKLLLLDPDLHLLKKVSNIFNEKDILLTDNFIEFVLDILVDIKLDFNQLSLLILNTKIEFVKNLLILQNYSGHENQIGEQINEIFKEIKSKNNETSNELYKIVFNLFYQDSDIILHELIWFELFEVLKNEDYQTLFNNPKSKLKDNLKKLIKDGDPRYLSEDIITLLIILSKKIGKIKFFHFIKSLNQDIRKKLKKGMKSKLENLKDEALSVQYHYLDKKELVKYLLEFLKLIN